MAHTTKAGPYTTFIHNENFSGDVTIIRFAGTSEEEKMELPIVVLEVLFAEKIRRTKIERLEQATSIEIIEAIKGTSL
jgi:hypothetical protein